MTRSSIAPTPVPEATAQVSIVKKRQIPRPDRLKTCQSALESYSNQMDRSIIDDDFANMDDVSETCEEGQRPHEAINIVTSRETPLKRNALASKQKGTYRGARRGSKPATNLKRS